MEGGETGSFLGEKVNRWVKGTTSGNKKPCGQKKGGVLEGSI